jgi:apolipoprotein N-acyltransferase
MLAAAGGGVLYFLGYLGWGLWPCLLAFLVPLWWALEHAGGARAALVAGLVFGLTAFAGGFPWLWHLVGPFLDGSRMLGTLLWLAYGAWFALAFGVYALLFHAIRRRGWSVALAGVAPFVAVEWLQPQIFPLYAGNGLVTVPVLAQSVDLGGPLLLTGLLVAANLALFAVVRGPRVRGAVGGVVAVLIVLAYGRYRMGQVDAAITRAPSLRVGIVQANLGLLDKATQSLLSHRRHVEQTHELLADGAVDLVVWPETAYVRGIRRPLPLAGRPILEDVETPLLFGASSVREENGRLVKTNAAFLIGPDAMIRDVYDKNLLIPFAEYLPLGGLVPGLRAVFPHVEEFAAATDVPSLRLGAWRLVTPICYEAVRPEFVRRMMRASAPHLIVTLANDAWFGDSHEPWLHLGLARLRAVEHRRFVVRATNSGISALVDPAGRVVARTGLLARENLRGEVRLLTGETPYARWGDWPGWLAAACVLLALSVRLTPRAPRG